MCKEDEHKLVYMDAKRNEIYKGCWTQYTKTYRFFCEKCGEVITKTNEDYCRETPDWY